MSGIEPVVEILPEGSQPPVEYQKITGHLIFDIKMDFTRKVRFVAGGHLTDPPSTVTYASVVSRESVRIAFLIAALNDLDIMAADIQGAYLNAPCGEKVYMILGPEFGKLNEGRIGVIVKALYGLKTSAYAWRSHLAETLRELNFEMCAADNDVWLRKAVKEDGTEYYEYVLVYTDDILAISHAPLEILNCLDQHYVLKPGSIGPPKQYLGAQVGEIRLPEEPEKVRWSLSSEKYAKEAIRNLQVWASPH
jgi:Reverse transcriptase (RNA-dependent DNA polymerase)